MHHLWRLYGNFSTIAGGWSLYCLSICYCLHYCMRELLRKKEFSLCIGLCGIFFSNISVMCLQVDLILEDFLSLWILLQVRLSLRLCLLYSLVGYFLQKLIELLELVVAVLLDLHLHLHSDLEYFV